MRNIHPSDGITCRVKNSFLHFEEKQEGPYPGLARSKSWSHSSRTSKTSSSLLIKPLIDAPAGFLHEILEGASFSSRSGGDADRHAGQASSTAATALIANVETDRRNVVPQSATLVERDQLPCSEDSRSPAPLMSKRGFTSRVNVTEPAQLKEKTAFSFIAGVVSIVLVAICSMFCFDYGNARGLRLPMSSDLLRGAMHGTEIADSQECSDDVLAPKSAVSKQKVAHPARGSPLGGYPALSGSEPKDVSRTIVPPASFARDASFPWEVFSKVRLEGAGGNLSQRQKPSFAEPSVLGICFRLRGEGGSDCSFTYKLQWSSGKDDMVADRDTKHIEFPCRHYELRWHDSGIRAKTSEHRTQALVVDEIKLEEVGTSWSQPHQALNEFPPPTDIVFRQPVEGPRDKDSLLTYKLQWQSRENELVVNRASQRIGLSSRQYALQWQKWRGRDQFCSQPSPLKHTYELRW